MLPNDELFELHGTSPDLLEAARAVETRASILCRFEVCAALT